MRNQLFRSFVILFAASALMFTSCSKDDDTLSSFVGSWTADSFTADNVEMMGTFFTSVSLNIGEMSNNSGDWNMTANVLGLGADTAIGTYIMNGDEMTVTVDGEATVFTYTVKGDTLTMRGYDEDDIFYVITCTRN